MGDVKCSREKPNVAIVGFAPSTRHQAPFYDESFEIWGLNELYLVIPRFDRWFEMHTRKEFESSFRNSQHLEWLRQCDKPIYMQERYKDIPFSLAYPRERMLSAFGHCFRSTFCYMLALAIEEGFSTIHLYGIDLFTKTEYYDERPSGEYLVGVARGRGVDVYIPDDSALLRGRLYGYDPYSAAERYHIRLNELISRRDKLQREISFLDGAVAESQGTVTGSSSLGQVMSALKVSLSGREKMEHIEKINRQHVQLSREYGIVSGAIQECRYWLSRVHELQDDV